MPAPTSFSPEVQAAMKSWYDKWGSVTSAPRSNGQAGQLAGQAINALVTYANPYFAFAPAAAALMGIGEGGDPNSQPFLQGLYSTNAGMKGWQAQDQIEGLAEQAKAAKAAGKPLNAPGSVGYNKLVGPSGSGMSLLMDPFTGTSYWSGTPTAWDLQNGRFFNGQVYNEKAGDPLRYYDPAEARAHYHSSGSNFLKALGPAVASYVGSSYLGKVGDKLGTQIGSAAGEATGGGIGEAVGTKIGSTLGNSIGNTLANDAVAAIAGRDVDLGGSLKNAVLGTAGGLAGSALGGYAGGLLGQPKLGQYVGGALGSSAGTGQNLTPALIQGGVAAGLTGLGSLINTLSPSTPAAVTGGGGGGSAGGGSSSGAGNMGLFDFTSSPSDYVSLPSSGGGIDWGALASSPSDYVSLPTNSPSFLDQLLGGLGTDNYPGYGVLLNPPAGASGSAPQTLPGTPPSQQQGPPAPTTTGGLGQRVGDWLKSPGARTAIGALLGTGVGLLGSSLGSSNSGAASGGYTGPALPQPNYGGGSPAAYQFPRFNAPDVAADPAVGPGKIPYLRGALMNAVLGQLRQPNYGAPTIDPRLLVQANPFAGGTIPADFMAALAPAPGGVYPPQQPGLQPIHGSIN